MSRLPSLPLARSLVLKSMPHGSSVMAFRGIGRSRFQQVSLCDEKQASAGRLAAISFREMLKCIGLNQQWRSNHHSIFWTMNILKDDAAN
jgi:hypothetical protein